MDKNRLSKSCFSGEERRKYKRFPFVFPVKYTYMGSGPGTARPSEFSLYSFSNNISRGGMMLTICNNVPVGENLDLVITLPIEHDVTILQASGRVQWIQKEDDAFLAGIEFIKISDNDLLVIEKFLDAEAF